MVECLFRMCLIMLWSPNLQASCRGVKFANFPCCAFRYSSARRLVSIGKSCGEGGLVIDFGCLVRWLSKPTCWGVCHSWAPEWQVRLLSGKLSGRGKSLGRTVRIVNLAGRSTMKSYIATLPVATAEWIGRKPTCNEKCTGKTNEPGWLAVGRGRRRAAAGRGR